MGRLETPRLPAADALTEWKGSGGFFLDLEADVAAFGAGAGAVDFDGGSGGLPPSAIIFVASWLCSAVSFGLSSSAFFFADSTPFAPASE